MLGVGGFGVGGWGRWGAWTGGGRGRRRVAADGSAGGIFVRTRSGFGGRACYPWRSGVSAGLLLLTLARVQCWLNFLSLLATVRGGTSFLCPTATKKRSKENASPQSVLSVPSVQTTAFGSHVARCSLEPPIVEALHLANSYIPTLRHQCSRASSMPRQPGTASPDAWLAAKFPVLIDCYRGCMRPV